MNVNLHVVHSVLWDTCIRQFDSPIAALPFIRRLVTRGLGYYWYALACIRPDAPLLISFNEKKMYREVHLEKLRSILRWWNVCCTLDGRFSGEADEALNWKAPLGWGAMVLASCYALGMKSEDQARLRSMTAVEAGPVIERFFEDVQFRNDGRVYYRSDDGTETFA
jgi:hypothetical protein